MTEIVKFSSKVSKRNRTGFVIGVPKNTISANPQIKHGSSVNVTLDIVQEEQTNQQNATE